MTVQARRRLAFTESATDHCGEDIRSHIGPRSRLDALVAFLKAGGARVRVEAE